MSIVLNPSLAVQNSLAMIAALSCVEFIREIPLYTAGATPNTKTITVKLLLAIIIVIVVIVLMTTFAGPDQPLPPGLGDARS
jgi:hypothetical protein